MTTSTKLPMMTAGEMLEARLCSPQCLLAYGAESAGECTCRCNGRWHGTLTHVEVDDAVVPWYERYCYYGPAVLDALCPLISGGIKTFNRDYRKAKKASRAFAVVQKQGATFDVSVDIETEAYDARLTDDAASLFESLLTALVRAGRVKTGSGGRSLIFAYGVKTQIEAQTLGALAIELHHKNADGANNCLRALDEDGFLR